MCVCVCVCVCPLLCVLVLSLSCAGLPWLAVSVCVKTRGRLCACVCVCMRAVLSRHMCCCRDLPTKYGLDKVAAALKQFNIHGLLFIGGFEVRGARSFCAGTLRTWAAFVLPVGAIRTCVWRTGPLGLHWFYPLECSEHGLRSFCALERSERVLCSFFTPGRSDTATHEHRALGFEVPLKQWQIRSQVGILQAKECWGGGRSSCPNICLQRYNKRCATPQISLVVLDLCMAE